jgi:hypothetical protein
MNDIAADQRGVIHNGFVLFDEQETLAGPCVCFNN